MAAVLAMPALGADELNWAQELVRPVEGTELHHNETVNFGRYKLVSGPAEKGVINAITSLEGKTSAISYTGTKNNSPFEIFSVYKNYLKQNKFEIVFACEKTECGDGFKGLWYKLNPFERLSDATPILHASGDQQHYIAAKKTIAGKDTYVSIIVMIAGWWNIPLYRVDVVQVEGLVTEVVPASKISQALSSEGRIAMYGITFDPGQSAIKPESEATLAELANVLKASGDVFYVVGHTDGEGTLADNMKLAQDRASAVKEALIGKYGVPAAMLSAHGGGPLSPLATNSTEAGRALNRRVEIVKAFGQARAAAPAAAPAPISSAIGALMPGQKPSAGGLPAGTIPQAQSPAQIKAAAQARADEARAQVEAAQAKAEAERKAALEKIKAAEAARKAAQAKAEAEAQASLIPVPNVIGQWLVDAQRILAGQGYKIQQIGKAAGKISAQSPASNTRVKKGSTVTITVGK